MPDYTAYEEGVRSQEERMYQEMREEQHRQEQLAHERQMEEYYRAIKQEFCTRQEMEEDKKKYPLFFWKENQDESI